MQIKHLSLSKAWLWKLLETYAMTLSTLRFQAQKRPGASALFIVPAERAGNLGDEAMLVGSIQHLRSQGVQTIGIVIFEPDAHWSKLPFIDEVIVLQHKVDYLNFVHAAYRYTSVYCIGADMMDGFYSDAATERLTRLSTLASNTGAAVSLLGFSFNAQPTPRSVAAIAQLPSDVKLLARDPTSRDRLTQAMPRAITLVADCAFLLKPATDSQMVATVLEWSQTQRQHNRTICGINVNNLLLCQSERIDAEALVQVYAKTLAALFRQQPNLSILLIPHDNRGSVSDETLARDLMRALPPSIQSHCMTLPFPCAAAEVKAVVAQLDFVLTGRMHLAIACLGQGVPVVGVAYQGKFEGLYRHFDLSGLTINPQQLLQPGALSQFLLKWLPQRHSLKAKIRANLPKVKSLAAANFQDVPGLSAATSMVPLSKGGSAVHAQPPHRATQTRSLSKLR